MKNKKTTTVDFNCREVSATKAFYYGNIICPGCKKTIYFDTQNYLLYTEKMMWEGRFKTICTCGNKFWWSLDFWTK